MIGRMLVLEGKMITGTDYPDLFHVDELFLLLKLYELVNMNKKARPPWQVGASGSEEEASPAGVCSHALRPGQGGLHLVHLPWSPHRLLRPGHRHAQLSRRTSVSFLGSQNILS